MPGEDKEAGMGVHSVRRAQAIRHGLPGADEDFTDFRILKGAAFQREEQARNLIHRGQEEGHGRAGNQGFQRMIEVFPGGAHVQKQGVGPAAALLQERKTV